MTGHALLRLRAQGGLETYTRPLCWALPRARVHASVFSPCECCAGRPNWWHGTPWCPKYDTNHSTMPMIYENFAGVYAQNILELRAWKARRILEVCQVGWKGVY